MSLRFVRFDPATVQLLDRCMLKALEVAATVTIGPNAVDIRDRLASALVEAVRQGERDESRLLEFALRVLPAFRERRL